MESFTFDRITRALKERRLSRRSTLGTAGSLGAAAVASMVTPGALAQDDATPIASPAADASSASEEIMFVQGFGGGSLEPKADNADEFTLTLTDGLGYTVYFTDRPAHQYGAMQTGAFVDGFNWNESNPPNAALVADTGGGNEQVLIVELTNPEYDDTSRSITYDALVLGDYEELNGALQQEPVSAVEAEPEFGSAHLFSDSCSTEAVHCLGPSDTCGDQGCDMVQVGSLGTMGFCWSFGDICCHPCSHSDNNYWKNECNNTFSACDGECTAQYSGCF